MFVIVEYLTHRFIVHLSERDKERVIFHFENRTNNFISLYDILGDSEGYFDVGMLVPIVNGEKKQTYTRTGFYTLIE